jgi:putative spermidine/putrescine transport system ATP-binding protein
MTQAATQEFLSLKGLHKSYHGALAIDHISLDIQRGEFMTFLGPSGSGKSTTLYITAGFESPTAGRVVLEGKDLLGVGPSQRNIGMVFQRYTLFPHLTVAENIAFPLRVRKWNDVKVRERLEKMLKLVHLDGFGHRMPAALSGGQQQRVAIARALAYDPPILLMDEPLSALDKKLREELQSELRRIHKETGVTILYVTHDQEEALRLSDRIAVFNKGRIEQVGTGPQLYGRPQTRFVAGFIGNSNFVKAQLCSSAQDRPVIRLPDGTLIACGHVSEGLQTGTNVQLLVRPDSLRLASHAAGADEKCTEVAILDRSYLGESTQFSVMTPWNQTIEVRMPQANAMDAAWNQGDKARLIWDETQSVCYPEMSS